MLLSWKTRQPAALLLGLTALACLAPPATSWAASLAEQKSEIRRAGTYLRSIERMLRADRQDDAAEMFDKAQAILSEVAKEPVDEKLDWLFQATKEQLAETHGLLSKAGVKVEPLANIESAAPMEPTLESGGGGGRFDPNQVSFVRDVAPMLAAKCGSCHIDGSRGGFSLATYQDLMRGSQNGGRVLVPGDGRTSLITELIVSGDMPRGGGQVSPQEVNKLVMWITQGAKFDGEDETANLRSLKPGGQPDPSPENGGAMAEQPAMKPASPTGKETVSFAVDVAPILTEQCANCHGGNNPRAGLALENFQQLLRGGNGGPIVKPKQADASPLVRRLKGDDAPRMPLNRPALSAKQIEIIETWVREGASFDGPNANSPLPQVTRLVTAQRATPDELSAIRVKEAEQNWRLAMAGDKAASHQTERYFLLGNLPEARLKEIGEEAERLTDGILKLFDHPSGEPMAKGRVTLMVFGHRIDYGEFGLMVRKRQAPKEERGVTGYDIVDAYAALQLGVSPEPGDSAVMAEQLAAIYLAERTTGRLPEWLLDGLARVAATRAAPDDERVQAWREAIRSEAAALRDPKDLLSNRLPPETAGLLRHGFAEGLMLRPKSVNKLIAAAAEGKEIDQVIKKEYGYTLEELAPIWVQGARRR